MRGGRLRVGGRGGGTWRVLPVVIVVLCVMLLHRQFTHKGTATSGSIGSPRSHRAPASPLLPDEAPLQNGTSAPPPDVHLLVIWNGAMPQREKILSHIGQHFHVVDARYFDWSSPQLSSSPARSTDPVHLQEDYFLMNLWRLYSGKGGGSKVGMQLKVRQCGRGPFIGLVVVDPKPVYRTEATAHGDDYVNHNLNDAKKLYRKWSGGGYKAHGTFNPTEAAHDVTLMFHKHPSVYAAEYQDQVAAYGSRSMDELSSTLLSTFRQQQPWPPVLGSRFYGTEGTLGLSSKTQFRAALPKLPQWASCKVLVDSLTAPWTIGEQRRMREEGFFAWDTQAAYPSDPLDANECASWPQDWAVVVPEQNWWAVASLLNGHISADVMSAATEGKPEYIAVGVSDSGLTFRIHVRGMLVEASP